MFINFLLNFIVHWFFWFRVRWVSEKWIKSNSQIIYLLNWCIIQK